MPPTGFDPRSNPRVDAYVRQLAGDAGIFGVIHLADEMYLYSLQSLKGCDEAAAILYYLKGRQIFLTVEEVVRWRFGGFSAVASFLDFASGFGRFTRFLVRELSATRVSISEIDPVAVEFQKDAFGVKGLVSDADPGGFGLPDAFDVILASSFFSHLPAPAFQAWLRRLYGLLRPGGLLLFSVHGKALLAESAADWSEGIVFRAESETTRLDPRDYGTSYVTEEFVRRAVGEATKGKGSMSGFPFGFCAQQDLYVVSRPSVPALSPLTLRRFPRGELDRFEIREEDVLVEGWAEGGPGERSPEVRLFIGGARAARSQGGGPGPARRWSFTFGRSAASPDDVVRVEAEGEPGFSNIVAMGTLRPFLPGASSAVPSD